MAGKELVTRQIAIMVSPGDYERLRVRFAASVSPTLSAFCREILLSRPVVIRYHNMAADEFLLIALEVKKELDGIIGHLRFESPCPCAERQLAGLLEKVEELKLIMHQIYHQWSSI